MKVLPGSLTHVMTDISAPPVERNETITNFEDKFLHVDEKTQMFYQLPIFRETIRKSKLKALQRKPSFFLLPIICLAM